MPKNILFVVDNLVMGGITKVISNLLKRLDYTKYNVDLLVLHYYKDMKVEIPENVKIISGNEYFSCVDENVKKIIKNKNINLLFNKLKLVFLLKTGLIKKTIAKSRKKILNKKYDTEIAFSDGFSHIFVAYGETPNKIAWMHTDISVQNDSRRYFKLVRESLKKMDMCVCVSDKVKKSYGETYGIDKIQTVHNVMDVEKIKNSAEEQIDYKFSKDVFNLISVGRVEAQKNYTRFVNVHKKLIEEGYNINSFIIGDGIELEELKSLVMKNGNEDTFKFLGRKDNPYPYVKEADLFVLSSNLEGLPTVLYEAAILGIPAISTDVAGAKEILGSTYGMVVNNDDESLYKGIKEILDKPELLENYKKNLNSYVFENDKIISKIDEIL